MTTGREEVVRYRASFVNRKFKFYLNANVSRRLCVYVLWYLFLMCP